MILRSPWKIFRRKAVPCYVGFYFFDVSHSYRLFDVPKVTSLPLIYIFRQNCHQRKELVCQYGNIVPPFLFFPSINIRLTSFEKEFVQKYFSEKLLVHQIIQRMVNCCIVFYLSTNDVSFCCYRSVVLRLLSRCHRLLIFHLTGA